MVKTWVWSLERADSSECVPVSPVLLSMRFHCGRQARGEESGRHGERRGQARGEESGRHGERRAGRGEQARGEESGRHGERRAAGTGRGERKNKVYSYMHEPYPLHCTCMYCWSEWCRHKVDFLNHVYMYTLHHSLTYTQKWLNPAF